MKLTSRADNFNEGVILGVEYTLPNGLKKRLEEHVSYEARYRIDPKHFANKLFAMAEQDIRKNMATTDYLPQEGQGLANGLLIGHANQYYTSATSSTTLDNAFGQAHQQYAQAYQQAYVSGWGMQANPPITAVLRFFRINSLVEHIEGSRLKEPLDELRIKVAKWLLP